MKKKDVSERRAKTKLALAEKYGKLAVLARSKPKKQQFKHKVERYRRQAAEALRT
jgi:hypothetical protein